jgi:uncharacterized caspase-like protein
MSFLSRCCLFVLPAALFPLRISGADELPSIPPLGRQVALLAGVSSQSHRFLRDPRYVDEEIYTLTAVLADAEFEVVEVLTEREEEKRGRRDHDPRSVNIRRRLEALAKDTEVMDILLFVFAGHCVQFKGEKEFYLCPSDAQPDKRETLVSLSWVYEQMKSSKAATKLCLFDVCRKDAIKKGAWSEKLEAAPAPQKIAPPEGVVALFSCAPGQISEENDDLRQTLFMRFLLHILRMEQGEETGGAARRGRAECAQTVRGSPPQPAVPRPQAVSLRRGHTD